MTCNSLIMERLKIESAIEKKEEDKNPFDFIHR